MEMVATVLNNKLYARVTSLYSLPVAELDKKSRGGRSSIEHEQRLCFDYEKMLIHTVF